MALQTQYESLMHELENHRKRGTVTAPEQRFVRAQALQVLAAKLHAAARLCDFPYEIIVRPEGVFVSIDGILLDTTHSAMYLKSTGAPAALQGTAFVQVLNRMHIAPATIVDIGANFGEVSLTLARVYPAARILAVEPASDNIAVFEQNRRVQRFPTQRIELIRLAVAAHAGEVAISKGAQTMNRVVAPGTIPNTEPVMCTRLDTLLDSKGIQTADFVKIDIEGSEPQLKEAIAALGRRVRSYIIEFSQFAPFADYLALAKTLLDQGFACFDEAATVQINSLEEIAAHMRAAFARGNIAVTNFWFFAPA